MRSQKEITYTRGGRPKVRNRLKHECRVDEVTRLLSWLVGFRAKRSGVMAVGLLWDCRPPTTSVRDQYRTNRKVERRGLPALPDSFTTNTSVASTFSRNNDDDAHIGKSIWIVFLMCWFELSK